MKYRLLIGAAVAIVGLVALASLVVTPDRPASSLAARWATAPSQFIELDGMEVHVRDEGPRDDPAPIVLVHGTGSSLHVWDAWTERLKADHRVIRFDRPGFGLTGPRPDGDYSMAGSADSLARLLDERDVDRAVIIGTSSGGRVAWEFAVRHPGRVSQLVLIAPAGYPRSTPLPMGLRLAMSPTMGPILEHVLPRSEVRKGLEKSYGDPAKVTREQVERSYELTLREGNRRALGQTLRQAQGTDNSAAIRTIQASTLILWGTLDAVIPADPDAARYKRDIAGSTLVMLPGLGHIPQEEDPEASIAPLIDFLLP